MSGNAIIRSSQAASSGGQYAAFTPGPRFATQPVTLQDELAMKQYLQALSGTLHITDVLTLDALLNAAKTHTTEGRFSDARTIYGQLLSTCERLLGGKHAFTLSVVNALGEVYFCQGATKKALHLYKRALIGLEETLGKAHPNTLAAVAAIGIAHLEQGELDTALPLLLRVVAGLEDIHGAEHPVPLVIAAVVAAVYSVRVDRDARQFVETALGRMERVFGEHHRLTRETAASLGLVHLRQGSYPQARVMFGKAEGKDPVFGGAEVDRGYWGWWLFLALTMLLGMYYFPKCAVVAGVLLGGYFLPKGVIVGGVVLGIYFYSRVNSVDTVH